MPPTGSTSALSLRVQRRAEPATDVVLLEFAESTGADLPPWEPGAHLDLRLPSGITRQYSLCGDPDDGRTYVVCVRRDRDGRGGSEEIHRTFHSGVEVASSSPRNHFRMQPSEHYVFIAGGIGITPIRSMIDQARAREASWHLFYGGRSRHYMAFADELTALDPGSVTVVPQDLSGLLDIEGIVAATPATAQIYCCGPAPMLDAVVNAAARADASGRLHLERFEAPVDQGLARSADNRAFEVELRASGVTLLVPAESSLLEAVQEVRPDIAFSCTEGYCGSCETAVIEGQPDHRGTLMSDEEHDEEGTMLICVGRSRTPRLVLDL